MRCAILLAAFTASASASGADNAQIGTDEERAPHVARFAQLMSAPHEWEAFMPPPAEEWYTVTIADVPVGFMQTVVSDADDGGIKTMELMDVQVSRGVDTSKMAFETVFEESKLELPNVAAVPAGRERYGGVTLMAYDQRFAENTVAMGARIRDGDIELTSNNGEKEHVSHVDLPTEDWLGRMHARLEFSRQCRLGAPEIVVQTMRPELGPKVVNLSSTFVRLDDVWDGEQMVESSIWTVSITDVPVNMTESYPVAGPLRCYRMLQMGLDMPFGFLLASLSDKEAALEAAKPDANRKLPELVYTMFVPLLAPIDNANEASALRLSVRVKGSKGPVKLELPTAGYQKVTPVKNNASRLHVTIDLQRPQKATQQELDDKDYSSPSAMIDNTDDAVRELAYSLDARLKAAGVAIPADCTSASADCSLSEKTELQLAYSLRDLVHTHISSKHLSTAYASASETARTGSGDCTEHAVLLAAVLKARNIPARVCHGLVYVEQGGSAITGSAEDGARDGNVQAEVGADGGAHDASLTGQFGWHMWSQALIGGAWRDLDATLEVPYSVGHVLVGTSSMSDKEAHQNHMQMAALIGNLEIIVMGVSHQWGQ